MRVLLSPRLHCIQSLVTRRQTLSIPNAPSQFTTGDSHEEILSAPPSLGSLFITPCRRGAKWSNSLSMKAHMIQVLLVFISHRSYTQQETLNQMTSLIFTCTMILDLSEAEKQMLLSLFHRWRHWGRKSVRERLQNKTRGLQFNCHMEKSI